jgi:hypothetical protein
MEEEAQAHLRLMKENQEAQTREVEVVELVQGIMVSGLVVAEVPVS